MLLDSELLAHIVNQVWVLFDDTRVFLYLFDFAIRELVDFTVRNKQADRAVLGGVDVLRVSYGRCIAEDCSVNYLRFGQVVM